jgi:hypothetical protein
MLLLAAAAAAAVVLVPRPLEAGIVEEKNGYGELTDEDDRDDEDDVVDAGEANRSSSWSLLSKSSSKKP